MKRLAVLVSGCMRQFEYIAKAFMEWVYRDGFDITVFVTTDRNRDLLRQFHCVPYNIKIQSRNHTLTESYIQKWYGTQTHVKFIDGGERKKYLEYTQQIAQDHGKHHSDVRNNCFTHLNKHLDQYFQLFLCNEERVKYEEEHAIVFDQVLRIRPDTYPVFDVDTISVEENTFYSGGNTRAICDLCFFSDGPTMTKVCSQFWNLHTKSDEICYNGGEIVGGTLIQLAGVVHACIPLCPSYIWQIKDLYKTEHPSAEVLKSIRENSRKLYSYLVHPEYADVIVVHTKGVFHISKHTCADNILHMLKQEKID